MGVNRDKWLSIDTKCGYDAIIVLFSAVVLLHLAVM